MKIKFQNRRYVLVVVVFASYITQFAHSFTQSVSHSVSSFCQKILNQSNYIESIKNGKQLKLFESEPNRAITIASSASSNGNITG